MPRCEHCNKDFSQKQKSKGRFCSPHCWQQSRRDRAMITCQICGKEQEVIKSLSNKKCCSIECRTEFIIRSRRIIRNCEYCNKEFIPTAYNGTYTRFCSNQCYHIATRTLADKVCPVCNKAFRPDVHYRKFCSRKCMKAHFWSGGETSIEFKVRSALTELGVAFIPEYRVRRFQIDFFLPDYSIAVEADGTHWHSFAVIKDRDARRDKYLASIGIKTIRLSEDEINHGRSLQRLSEELGCTTVRASYSQLQLFDLHNQPQEQPNDHQDLSG
jgi:very-short-patch-repair endonuclease